MSQPSFTPVPAAGEVRAVMETPTPEVGRAPKPGLLRTTHPEAGRMLGTPGPDAGFALTIAHRVVARRDFEREADRHDVELGVALVAAKRASLVGRGPIVGDVDAAMAALGLGADGPVNAAVSARFAGLAHSYPAQRELVDSVDAAALLGR
ncbi:MAG TPA: hypothetical protein VGS61_06890 [Acidimicrobiales bacterium]|nr:hypothetical protein [Acidimicrobiales bacterium]